MNIIEILLIPFAIFIGIITSYEDYKEGRIRNKWIVISLVYSLAVLLGVIIFLSYMGTPMNPNYIYEYFLNVFFALFAGSMIWFAGLWPAGDAKLFVAYSALIPLSVYKWGYIQHFPSFIIMINTFAPLFVFYFLKLIFKVTTKEKIEIMKGLINPRFVLSSVLFIFAFLWVIGLFSSFMNKYTTLANNIFVTIALLFIIMLFLNNILKINILFLSIPISIIEILLDYKNIFTMAYLTKFIVIVLLFIFLRYFVINLGFKIFSKPIYIENLKIGMIPSENIIVQESNSQNFSKTTLTYINKLIHMIKDKLSKYKIKEAATPNLKKDGVSNKSMPYTETTYYKKKLLPISFLSGLLDGAENRLFRSVSDGLTEIEIKKIQKLHSEGKIKEHSIMIGDVVPFAPFMFLGILITILCKGNIMIYIMSLLEKFI